MELILLGLIKIFLIVIILVWIFEIVIWVFIMFALLTIFIGYISVLFKRRRR